MGNSIIVWITVLLVIFFSSLMWFRMTVCDSATDSFTELIGMTVSADMIRQSISHVDTDILIRSIIELCVLVSLLAIILNLISILHKHEKDLIVEKLKAEESANKSKSFFFSTISHDIRTPLSAIIGYSQMLQMDFNKKEEREQALNSIIVGGKALIHLIDEAIDFAKLEDGHLEFEPKPTGCAGLVRGFVASFHSQNQSQSVELRCKSGEMPTVRIDPKRIRQILFYLVDNATKFTQHGFVEVRSSFETVSGTDKGTLRPEVEDTGCGISKEDLKQITSPYVQVDSKLARHGGTGIGLAVCRKLASAMGGDLSIVSELGKGSTFAVTVFNVKVTEEAPVEDEVLETDRIEIRPNTSQQEPAAAVKEEEKPDESAEVVAQKRILIVDDQKVNLMVLKAMLKKIGPFDIVMARDGKEALDILVSADTPFALVLTDMWMPVIDGEGLVRAIRADEKLAALPVHVVTEDTEMQGKYSKIGFDGMQLKPVSVEKLKEIIE